MYLAQAAVLVLGAEGMRHQRDPGPRLECNMCAGGSLYPDLKRLPLHLLDAGLGAERVASYAKLKHDEWNRYCNVVSEWERDTTLDR